MTRRSEEDPETLQRLSQLGVIIEDRAEHHLGQDLGVCR